MKITFRPARQDDVEAAIPLMISSGPAAFDYVFTLANSKNVSEFLRAAFLDGAGQFGYRNQIVAVAGEQVVATGAGYSGKTTLPFMAAGARQILSRYGVQGLGVIVRGLRTEQIVPPPGRKEWYLAHLGVNPTMRSHGIGKQLIAHLLGLGKTAGYALAVLDVATDNPRAQVLYESVGFRVTHERVSTLRNAVSYVPSHRRMARPL